MFFEKMTHRLKKVSFNLMISDKLCFLKLTLILYNFNINFKQWRH